MTACELITGATIDKVGSLAASWLPNGQFRRIMLKPNWVRHADHPAFPIAALVTSADVIDAVLTACVEKYPGADEIIVGDVPLQSCDWERLYTQAGIDRLAQKWSRYTRPAIRFLDLRQEKFDMRGGFMEPSCNGRFGDPGGYREVLLDEESFLEDVSADSDKFRVSDYSPQEMASSHRRGHHRYLITGSALDAELFINLPKLKTHQKSGLTCALKNIVGMNGNKAFLVHHREGLDEFPPGISPWIVAQTRVRALTQQRSKTVFRLLRAPWKLIRKWKGIETEATPENLEKNVYIAAGSWYGNDSVWRMIYDLNRIIRYATPTGGRLATTPQREYLTIVDAITAGEGNGPLQALPVDFGCALAGTDPFLIDCVAARIIGFDENKIPMLSQRKLFDDEWGSFDRDRAMISLNGSIVTAIDDLPVLRNFAAPPGWKNHVELPVKDTVLS